jgi:hypothetical protein
MSGTWSWLIRALLRKLGRGGCSGSALLIIDSRVEVWFSGRSALSARMVMRLKVMLAIGEDWRDADQH